MYSQNLKHNDPFHWLFARAAENIACDIRMAEDKRDTVSDHCDAQS